MTRIARLLASMCLVQLISACQAVTEDRESWLIGTSVVTLLANPSDYDNLHVQTRGFLANDGGPVLFLTRDHARIHDIISGIPLSVPDEKIGSLRNSGCFDKYVSVIGRFVVEHEYVGKSLKVRSIRDILATRTCWRAD